MKSQESAGCYMREINIEGYSPDEILDLPDEQLDARALHAQ